MRREGEGRRRGGRIMDWKGKGGKGWGWDGKGRGGEKRWKDRGREGMERRGRGEERG